MKKRFRIGLLLGAIACLFGAWSFYFEPSSLRVKEYTLALPRWKKPLSGMRVALLTDLHVGSAYIGLDKLRKIVELTNAASPDIILITGDFVAEDAMLGGDFIPPEEFVSVLAGLKAPQGVYAVLGNHDWALGAHRVRSVLENNHIPVIDDDAVPLSYRDTEFWLMGVSDAEEGPHDIHAALTNVPAGAPALLMTHNPDIFPEVPENVSLTVAGHTHCGQVYVPLLGRPVIPSRHGQRFAKGHIVENGRHLFVGCGIGTSIYPVRFLSLPEITLLVLKELE